MKHRWSARMFGRFVGLLGLVMIQLAALHLPVVAEHSSVEVSIAPTANDEQTDKSNKDKEKDKKNDKEEEQKKKDKKKKEDKAPKEAKEDDDHDDSDNNDDSGDDDDDYDDDDDCEDEHAADEGCVYVSRQIVVKLNPALNAAIDTINLAYGTVTLQPLLGSAGIYLLETPTLDQVGPLLVEMRGDERLLYAEPNFYGEAPEGGGRGKWAWGGSAPVPAGLSEANPQLNLAEIHQLSRGEATVVAVLDTGFQLNHPQLVGRWSSTRYDFVDDDPIPAEIYTPQELATGRTNQIAGHGTHVAGIISMVAPDAQIMPLRVLDHEGRGSVFVIAEAVLYAVEHGADVINLSLGTTRSSDLLGDIIEDAVEDDDVVVVAAAGNLNSGLPQFPAADDEVIAVSATDGNGLRADFANYGGWVDVAAPGVGIFSAYPVNSYAYWSGTSMATPFVAGQAALLRSVDPTLSAEDIEEYIVETASPLGNELGGGGIDLASSLIAAGASPTPLAARQ